MNNLQKQAQTIQSRLNILNKDILAYMNVKDFVIGGHTWERLNNKVSRYMSKIDQSVFNVTYVKSKNKYEVTIKE